MLTAALLAVAGLIVFGVAIGARWLEARAWRRTLRACKVVFPASLTADEVTAWLSGTAASTHAPRLALLPFPPVALEIRATHKGIEHFLLFPEKLRGVMLSGLRAAMPAVRITDDETYLNERPRCRVAA